MNSPLDRLTPREGDVLRLLYEGRLNKQIGAELGIAERTVKQLPQLVAGLPWRFAPHIKPPVVPEAEFAPLDLSYISRQ